MNTESKKFAHQIGKAIKAIEAKFENKVTPTAINNVARQPNLIRQFLRHIDLSGFEIPAAPTNWRANCETECAFWFGYYAKS